LHNSLGTKKTGFLPEITHGFISLVDDRCLILGEVHGAALDGLPYEQLQQLRGKALHQGCLWNKIAPFRDSLLAMVVNACSFSASKLNYE